MTTRSSPTGSPVPGPSAAGTAGPAVDGPARPVDLGRLRWRCRRGMKELDVLLERYVERRFAHASDAERVAFRQLLDVQDPEIYAYCFGSERPPDRFAALIARITENPSDRR